MKLAAVQMISGPDVAPNLATAGRLIAEAAAAGAQLVALPEYFPLIGASDADRLAARERDGSGPIQDFLAAAAQKHGLWLVGGSIPLLADDPAKLRNSCLVYDPAGRRVARYDKIHLFGFRKGAEAYDESGDHRARQTGRGLRHAVRPAFAPSRPRHLLRPALPGTLPRHGWENSRSSGAARGLHRDHRPRPLGNAAARARRRKPVLRAGSGTGRACIPRGA
jgi:hypothetical protein